jgi:putative peptide maturation system protein
VAGFLPSLARELWQMQKARLAPDDAMARSRVLSVPPNWRADLFWQREAATGRLTYDLVLTSSLSRHSVCLTVLDDSDLPWPLRGACNFSEQELGKVNGRIVEVEEAVAWLELLEPSGSAIKLLLNHAIVDSHRWREAQAPTPEQIQRAMDQIRSRRGLLTREATLEWMRQTGFTHERLEREATYLAAFVALRDSVTAGGVEDAFRQSPSRYRRILVNTLDFKSREAALAVRTKLSQEGGSLSNLWRTITEGALFESDPPDGAKGMSFSSSLKFAWELERELPSPPCEPGSLALATVGKGGLPTLFRLTEIVRTFEPRLDTATTASIKEDLFERWMAAQQAQAQVEWYWGRQHADASLVVDR